MNCVLAARYSFGCECPYVFFFVALAVAVSSFLSRRDRYSNSPTSFLLSLKFISATHGLASSTSFLAATARSTNMAKFSSDALSGCVAKCASTEGGICRMKAWRITALPTTAFVSKPAVFYNRLRNLDGMSDPSFSPEITLLTLSGVVKPRRSIWIAFKFSYL